MTTTDFVIQLATVPDRDGVVAEIWGDRELLAELQLKESQVQVELYHRQDGRPWVLSYDKLVELLSKAQAQLRT